MAKRHSYSLVEGTFSKEDASDILMSLLSSKIKFHSLKIMSSKERTGQKDPHSEQRKEELKEIRREIFELLDGLEGRDISIKIDSTIHLQVDDENGE